MTAQKSELEWQEMIIYMKTNISRIDRNILKYIKTEIEEIRLNGIRHKKKCRQTHEYSMWKEKVKNRDGGICTNCGVNENLHIHHIKSFAQYPELRINVSNGITLCKECHMEVHRGN